MNIEATREYYKKAPTPKLLTLLTGLSDLEPEVLPLLLSEFESRNETDAAGKVKSFLANENDGEGLESEDFDIEDLRQEVKERLAEGETIESIKFDLKDRLGYDVYERLIDELIQQDTIDEFQYSAAVLNALQMNEANESKETMMQNLKEFGLSAANAAEIIEKSKNNSDALIDEVNLKLRARAKKDIIYGTIITLLVIFSAVIQFADSMGVFIFAIGLFVYGILLLIRGIRILKRVSEA